MAIICSKYHSTRDFSFKNGCFVQEASTLTHGLSATHDGRVYDDAADVGFVMVSHRTGNSILFVNDGVDMSGDNVAGWRYKATHIADRSIANRWHPLPQDQGELYQLKVLIIND